ncbi:MAG: hypothetical protein QOI20_2777 [Acidimicrobiaceae bacterium]|jgi:hypothetical protein|nr:hypothetical protein [Acidimicrobiaceae bacterium]
MSLFTGADLGVGMRGSEEASWNQLLSAPLRNAVLGAFSRIAAIRLAGCSHNDTQVYPCLYGRRRWRHSPNVR